MPNFRESFEKTIEASGGHFGSQIGNQYVAQVETSIDDAIESIKNIVITKDGVLTEKGVHYIKGDLSEPWHAGTLNVHAAAKGLKGTSASVPRDHSPIDVVVKSPTETI